MFFLSNDFYVLEPNIHSDHCPIVLTLGNLCIINSKRNKEFTSCNSSNACLTTSNPFTSFNLDKVKTDEFISKMSDAYASSNLNSILEITENISFELDKDDIENCINGISHVLDYATSDYVYKANFKNTTTHNGKSITHLNNNNWFDNECISKRKEFIIARDIYHETLLEEDLKTFCNIRNTYRKICRKKRKDYNFKTAKNLVTLSKNNSKLFWRKIKRKV